MFRNLECKAIIKILRISDYLPPPIVKNKLIIKTNYNKITDYYFFYKNVITYGKQFTIRQNIE